MLQAGCRGGNRQHMLSLLIATMVIAYIMGGMLGVFYQRFLLKKTLTGRAGDVVAGRTEHASLPDPSCEMVWT